MSRAAPIAGCAEEAPIMAGRFSTDSGARVGRTALRVRNAANAPDPAAVAVLEDFQSRIDVGAEPPLEHFEVREDGSARYLRAIVMQPLCTTCHGADVAPFVRQAIVARYPEDAATGFKVGQLRGAFVVEWPAEGPAP